MRRPGCFSGLSRSLWISALLLLAVSFVALICLRKWRMYEYVFFFLLAASIYGFAARCLITGRMYAASQERRCLVAILIIAGLLRAMALFAPQALSTDVFRYVWDGRVQGAGVNPYRYVPADAALTGLRDEKIYPNINRAEYAHTIYPPTAEISFWAITRISHSVLGMKIGMLAFDGLTIACLLGLLRAQGLPSTRVLLYAWHPLPIWEFAGTGHVDALALAFGMLAFLAASRRAPIWTGAALAAATLVKYYPVVVAPALYKRWDWRMPAAFLCVLIVLYAPYLGVGRSVMGFLSGYAAEEGLRDGSGIFPWSLLSTFLHHLPADALRYYAPIVALLMGSLSLWLQFGRRSAAGGPMAGPLLLAGVFTVLVTPHDPWYFTWIVPFFCFRVSLAYLWLTVACVIMYVLPDPTGIRTQALLYVPFFLLLVFQYFIERRPTSPETINAHCAHHPSRA